MKIRFLLFSLTMAAGLHAQEFVAFSNASSNLGSITGFAYNDCVVDMNGDGLDDVVRITNQNIFIDFQQPDGSLELEAFPIPLFNLPSWSVAAGDIDGNGFNDLLLGAGDAVSFVKANADGTAYTETAMPENIFSQRSTFADIDNDGDLDAFVCHDVDQSHPYRNDGNGNMVEDQTLIETIDLPGNYSAIWTDYDNDGDIDMYLTKCRGGATPGDPARTNAMYRNNGDGTFTEVGAETGLDDNAQSWSTVFEDFDNDGDFDAFIVNHDFQNRFFLNNGDGTFTDIIGSTGINANDLGAWENASGDFNNDGFIDIFSELSKEIYLNNGNLTFTPQDLPVDPGAIGDLNDDGFLDVVTGSSLYLNSGNDNNYLKVNTLGILSNKNGIGARVEIHGDWGIQIREVRSGQSFAPMSSLQIHFGLGEATSVDQLVVKWPSGMVTVIENPEINTTIDVPEADCLLSDTDIMVDGQINNDIAICPGDNILLEVPATFSNILWSNGESGPTLNVSEGGYFSAVLYDDEDCVSFTNTVTVTVIEEAPPVIEILGNDVACQGHEVSLIVTGGTEYTWSNGDEGETISVSESGQYTVSTLGACTGAPYASEPVDITILAAPAPITETMIEVWWGEQANLTADGQGGEVHWYLEPTGGTSVSIGNDYLTPPVEGWLQVFVESEHHYPGEEQTGGKPDFTGDGGLPSQGSYNLFDVWEPFTLNTVLVLVPNGSPSGNRTIQLVDGTENLLAEATFDLSPGSHVLELNFDIPIGSGLSLRCLENNLYRDNGSNLSYPYPIGDVGELTTSAFGTGYYYYFYDWRITVGERDCVSERIEINLTGADATYEALLAAGVEIFPNPTSHELFVKMESPASFVRLMDITGRQLSYQDVNGNETVSFDVSSIASGVYALQIEVDGKILSTKVLVE